MTVRKLGMPKWGLSMREGALVAWLVEEGAELSAGQEVAEVETEKINGVVESPAAGVLRRRVASVGDVVPVGGLLGVIADAATGDAEIDEFISDFAATFVPEESDGNGGPAAETVTADGWQLRILRQGEGAEAVLLVHGFGGDLTTWLFNQSALAADGRLVVAVDLPGHGGSTKDVGAGDAGALADALVALVGALGLDRVHLVGHSLGGAVCALAAARLGGRAASLTLVAPAGLGAEIDGAFVDGFVAAESRRELKPVLERLFASPEVVTRQFTDDVLRTKRVDGADEALRAIAAACFPGGRQTVSAAGAVGAFAGPVLAIWGADDAIVPPAHAAALPPGARVETIADAGHMPQMEAAGEVNRILGEFLARAGAS
jgi:pyruvate dehydrogenase E2 component (dihydrolipoamide acetyltransferase)